MAKIQPPLSQTELALVDQLAALTGSKRTEVIKNALAVHHWFVLQAIIGSRVVARKPTGEEIGLESSELEFGRLLPEQTILHCGSDY